MGPPIIPNCQLGIQMMTFPMETSPHHVSMMNLKKALLDQTSARSSPTYCIIQWPTSPSGEPKQGIEPLGTIIQKFTASECGGSL